MSRKSGWIKCQRRGSAAAVAHKVRHHVQPCGKVDGLDSQSRTPQELVLQIKVEDALWTSRSLQVDNEPAIFGVR
jgi:hypothetical protein